MKYKLMPEEPTREMVLTGKHTIKGADNAEFESNIARYAYQSMWQAAPDEPLTPECGDAGAVLSKWQPIETAPKDTGAMYLLWVKDGDDNDTGLFIVSSGYDADFNEFFEAPTGEPFKCTHWMRLPEPPKE